MSYSLTVNSDYPLALWMMDDTSPFQDHSGRDAVANTKFGTAAPIVGTPVVSSAAFSSICDTTHQGEYASPVFKQGYESQPFVLEAWVYPINPSNNPIQVMSHPGQYDGLYISGSKVGFSVKFATTGTCAAEFDYGLPRAMHIVGSYTGNSVSLYVNGQKVADSFLTDAQANDTFVATDGKLYSGNTTSSQKVALNGLAIYAGLSSSAIVNHYSSGRVYSAQSTIAAGISAESIDLVPQNKFMDMTLDSVSYSRGLAVNVVSIDDVMQPLIVDNVSVAGTWTYSLPLYAGVTSIYGITMDWLGHGATVVSSIDETTWSAVTRNVPLSSVGATFNPTDQTLYIRVSFVGGIAYDDSFISNIRIVGYINGVVNNSLSRPVIAAYPAAVMSDHEPSELNDENGVSLNGGTLTVSGDSTMPVKSVLIWMKAAADNSITTNLTGANNVYSNGGTAYNPRAGEWQMRTFTFNAAFTTSIVISGTGTIGQIILAPAVLSSTKVTKLFQAFTGAPVTRIIESSPLVTFTSPDNVISYVHDWETISSD